MIETFLKHIEYEKRYSTHTLTAYRKDLNQFEEFLHDTFEIDNTLEVIHPQLRSWVVELIDNGQSPKTVNRKIATLKSYYKFLVLREYLEANPTSRLKPLKTDKPLPVFIRESEMNVLLDQVIFNDDLQGARDRLILEMLYNTGIRLSELIGLKISDVSFYQNTIKVLGKRNKERLIPIHDFLVKLIKKYLLFRNKEDASIYLITTENGSQLYPMLVYRTVKKYLEIITTQSKTSPHVLRHTFATHLLNKGADLNAVKDLLGHTSLAATQVYTHNSMEKLKSAFDQAHPKA
ncbi:MAG: tyrosine-type recombinase/integrase [Cyclobacteriaceae bacterium]